MTFQGDVGGIGLADLLQSLARGRDGVLTLLGREGLQGTLGVEGGMIHLLPEPGEDPQVWRERARAAWAGDPSSRIDAVRMMEIARAHRIEIIYSLLDSDAVHFRFTPGPVPKPTVDPAISKSETGFSRPGARRDGVWCAPISVDGLLLEYARLKDEAADIGPAFDVDFHAVLRVLDPSMAQGEYQRFATECDGTSSVREIADRLGWALRQMRIVTGVAIAQGRLCEAQPEELLNLAQKELLAGHAERAASRLTAWNRMSLPGPVSEPDAEFFVGEWNGGRLQPVLKLLDRPVARAILRRVDSVIFNPMASAERWKEYAEGTAPDPISAFRVLVCQIRTGSEGGLPPVRELLTAARSFNERRQTMRAAAILRIAAERQPDTSSIRMELGHGFLNAGFPQEGAPWILEAAKTLIDEKHGDKAVAALRALLEMMPSHREARRLLSRARAGAVRRQLTGGHAALLAAGVAILLMIGFVQYRMRSNEHRKLAAVQERISDPEAALELLAQEFPGEASDDVQQLRTDIEKRRKDEGAATRAAWTAQYREAQTECSGGDPLQGLRRAMEIPPPPQSPYDTEEWPAVSDLFNLIAARGESAFRELDEKVQDDKEQLHAERRIVKLLEDLRTETAGKEDRQEVKRFVARLDDLKTRVEERANQRATEREEFLKRDNLARQDLLLAAARAHAKAGDHSRALAVYRDLISTDQTGKLESVLAPEMKVEQDRHDALVDARELALAGRHPEARAKLTAVLDNADDYLLPWRVVTVPSGARVRFPDGTERVTPFTLETAFGERVSMTISREGSEPVQVDVSEPGDQTVYLTRSPERWWHSAGRVEAMPVAVGDDHVLCDRSGTIVRMTRDGSLAWTTKITSLAGIARSPVSLGEASGKCLIVAEDGQAWTCDTTTGALDGPLALGASPAEGPKRCAEGVWARLRDGRTAVWTTELAPTLSQVGAGTDCTPAEGDASAMAILRRSATSATTLKSPWSGWTVDVGDKGCALIGPGEREASSSIRREGAWTFVAWEAPGVQSPAGRLWIADGLGLRSYKP